MLFKLYPKVHRRYTSLPVLGPVLNEFATWLLKQGYSTDCVREHFCAARRLERILQQQGIRNVARLTRARLRACAPANRLDDKRLTASVRLLERYFESETSLYPPRPLSRIEQRVALYATYLERVRGLASSGIAAHCKTAAALLAHIDYEAKPCRLRALTAHDIEAFNQLRILRHKLMNNESRARSSVGVQACCASPNSFDRPEKVPATADVATCA